MRCRVEGGKGLSRYWLVIKNNNTQLEVGEGKRRAATKRNCIKNLRTGPWTEEGPGKMK